MPAETGSSSCVEVLARRPTAEPRPSNRPADGGWRVGPAEVGERRWSSTGELTLTERMLSRVPADRILRNRFPPPKGMTKSDVAGLCIGSGRSGAEWGWLSSAIGRRGTYTVWTGSAEDDGTEASMWTEEVEDELNEGA